MVSIPTNGGPSPFPSWPLPLPLPRREGRYHQDTPMANHQHLTTITQHPSLAVTLCELCMPKAFCGSEAPPPSPPPKGGALSPRYPYGLDVGFVMSLNGRLIGVTSHFTPLPMGEGPVVLGVRLLFFFPSPPLLFKKINRIFAEKIPLARCRDSNVKDRKDGRGAGN